MPEKSTARPRPLVLGSTSRYRREHLARLGLPFEVSAPDIDETPLPGELPVATALRLSEAKARAVAARYADALVIGSDQVADCDGRAVSKPGDRATAQRELRALSGRTIVFHTGVALVDATSGPLPARDGRRRQRVPRAHRRRDRRLSRARSALRLRRRRQIRGARHRAVRAHHVRRSDRARGPAADRAVPHAARRRRAIALSR